MKTKYVGMAIMITFGLAVHEKAANGLEPDVPEPFQGYDDASRFVINYDDLDELLDMLVVDVGRSKREIASPARATTGTRMKTKIKRFTENEGNRFFYETFNDNEVARQFLRDLKTNLESLPSEMPLERFSRDEQLAYWLNLYNVTILNEVLNVYPKRNLERMFRGKKSVLAKKVLTVAGVPLSLNDIQFTILKQNYDNNPLIMYGLYKGIVGGPNIRRTAYTGNDVYFALEENAYEFVNSNRGTLTNSKGDFRVSSLYGRSRAYFSDFNSDLTRHLLRYLDEGDERTQLKSATKLKPDINDWTVTDLGGTDHQVGGSFSHNHAALLDAYRGPKRADGSIMVASVIVKKKKKVEEDTDEETDAIIREIEEFPKKNRGASVEGIVVEEENSTD